LKKTQLKKTPFSDRRTYHTFGTALTEISAPERQLGAETGADPAAIAMFTL
jgi:hypothetical protein